jgi:hypothetical protein
VNDQPPRFVAGFDSASAMTRATAAFLRGEDFPAMGNPPALQPIAAAANMLPAKVREKLFVVSGALETVDADELADLDLDEVGAWVERIYPEGPFPVIALGSSNGAGVHLHAALGAPFLPQTVFVPADQKVHPDDPTKAMELGVEPGRALLDANPDWQLHHMHDANQDRLMVRALTYFRVKRRRLGDHERRFLAQRLQPGGTILLMECTRSWSTTRVGDRHVFQHGAVGGATEQEFHEGSERVAEYLDRYDSPVRRWDGPEPDTVSAEAEWGFEAALREDVLAFAREHGVRVRRLVHDDPSSLGPLVADLYRWWYGERGWPTHRLLISSFIALDPYWALRTASVPFWMRFNMQPSLEAVRDYLVTREPFDDIHLMLFQHGVEAVGIPDGADWQREVLDRARRSGTTLGADLDEFPLDFAAYGRFHRELKALPSRYPLPAPLTMADLDRFLDQAPTYPDVEVADVDP